MGIQRIAAPHEAPPEMDDVPVLAKESVMNSIKECDGPDVGRCEGMAIDRTIWIGVFEANQFPTFPCPQCNHGRLIFQNNTLRREEPKHSELAKQHDAWEPEWTVERFSVHLRCAEPACGEIVVVSGDNEWVEIQDEEVGWSITSALRPRMMYPPPPIILLPENTPSTVSERIEAACGLFWFDVGAAANSLKMSVKFLLDHLNVPRNSISKKTGKNFDLDLNGRIQFYEKSSPPHAETFHALRVIGNLGSQGTNVTKDTLLDAFEIYEDALSEVIGERTARLNAIKRKILEKRKQAD